MSTNKNAKTPTVSSLSPACGRLFEILREIQFGRVESLHVRHGEPVFEPAPRVVRHHKFGSPTCQAKPVQPATQLKQEVVDLFEFLKGFGDGVVTLIKVAEGLPLAAETAGPGA